MFLDTLDPRKRISANAQAFFADQEHYELICEFGAVEWEVLSDCYDYLWTLPVEGRMEYAAMVRDALSKELLLPTPSKMRRAQRQAILQGQ